MIKSATIFLITFALCFGVVGLASAATIRLPNPLCPRGSQQVCHAVCDYDAWRGNTSSTTFQLYQSFAECCTDVGAPITNSSGTAACVDNFPALITTIASFVTGLIGALAVIVMVYAGILYVLSAGDPGKVGAAKQAVIYAIIGLAVALAGTGLIGVIQGVIGTP